MQFQLTSRCKLTAPSLSLKAPLLWIAGLCQLLTFQFSHMERPLSNAVQAFTRIEFQQNEMQLEYLKLTLNRLERVTGFEPAPPGWAPVIRL